MAGSYVLAASVFIRMEDGLQVRYRQGDVITGLSDEDAERLLSAGAIVAQGDVAETGSGEGESDNPETGPGDDEPADEADDDEVVPELPVGAAPVRPKSASTTEVWRQYAIDMGIPAEQAATMSKVEIREATR